MLSIQEQANHNTEESAVVTKYRLPAHHGAENPTSEPVEPTGNWGSNRFGPFKVSELFVASAQGTPLKGDDDSY
ncbi:unnamed protein product [Phytophthora lilii]|uniref:Unnamed protein product n=1 Tax=Phytophthora lilii TaxID=2077276 RepID=A0A9W6TR29_9STRA|nr:unnamed protein product [Phytophthora lilii]